eukprot:jgi/Astpho2/9553/Aster-x1586
MRMLAKLDRIRRDVEQADTTGCCWRLLQYAQLHLMDDLTEEEADSMAARGLFWKWTDVQKLVVLGLGSFESTSGSRSLQQLAFAQLLSRRLPGLVTQPAAFDPVFTQSDKHLLTACGFQVADAQATASDSMQNSNMSTSSSLQVP